MSARCDACGRYVPTDTHSIKLHGLDCQIREAEERSDAHSRIARHHASYDFVTDRLAIGDVNSRTVPGFVAVVSLLSTAPWDEVRGAPHVPHGYTRAPGTSPYPVVHHIDIGDGESRKQHPGSGEFYGHDLDEYLDAVTAFIASSIQFGCVLVHCGAGKSRSAAVVVAYLCRYAGMSYVEALALVQARRNGAAPADCFAEAIKRWLRLDELAKKGPRSIEEVTHAK
jgi:Dual specificity phosphatase, catalytic domain